MRAPWWAFLPRNGYWLLRMPEFWLVSIKFWRMLTIGFPSYWMTTGLIPTGTMCPEMAIGVLAVVMSWYCVHWDATV